MDFGKIAFNMASSNASALNQLTGNTQIDGYKYAAVHNSMSLVQPVTLFDLTNVPYTVGDIGKFSIKVTTKSANVLKLSGQRWFVNAEKVAIDSTTGSQVTGDTDLILAVSVPQNETITFTYSKPMTTKNVAVHIYTDFKLVVGATLTDILLYDASFEINGVKATRVTGTALYSKTASDSFSKVTTLETGLATKQYVSDQLLAISSSSNRLSGKTWSAIGDSITYGQLTTKAYHVYIKEAYGLTAVNNYGIMGSTVGKYNTTDDHQSMALRYTSMLDADFITVFGGTNDAASFPPYIPIGVMTDRTVDTFYGAYHILISGLIAKFPSRKIATFTPLQRTGQSALLIPFVQAVKEISAFYSIPCLDLFYAGGMPADVGTFKGAYMPDGTHPNAEGHKLLADKIAAFLLSL